MNLNDNGDNGENETVTAGEGLSSGRCGSEAQTQSPLKDPQTEME